MNLYNLHSNPKSLYGYRDRWKIPEIAYAMAVKNRKVRNPKLERVIMQNPALAYRYARYILNDPKNPKKQRWPEAEPYIMQDPLWAYQYALNILKGRWQEAEPYIIQDPKLAFQYAYYILNDPKNPKKQRWSEAEPYIMQDPLWAYWYAFYILNGRWTDIGKPEAEEYIKRDAYVWDEYKEHFGIKS